MKKLAIIFILALMISCLSAENPWLGRDKIAHFTASAFLTYWNFGVGKDFLQQNTNNSLLISVSFTALLGAGKEYSDKNIVKSEWSWHDIAFDIGGIIAGLVLVNNLR